MKNNFFKYLFLSLVTTSFVFTNIAHANSENSAKESLSKSEINKIPKFPILLDIDSKKIDLNKKITEKNTILIFYRGGWCPYCNKHLADLRKIEKDILDLGFQIIAISPDKPEKLKESIDKHNISYLLVSDSKMEVAKNLNLSFKVDDITFTKYKTLGINLKDYSGEEHRLLPIPSVFIIDKSGNIQFKHSNEDYKLRLESSYILDKVKSLSINN